MRDEFLDILREPGTGSPLTLSGAKRKDGRIEEGVLLAEGSDKSYPIVGGIPRFVPAENYAGSFGLQWNRFRDVQIDSQNGRSFSRSRFDSETGWGPEQVKGRLVLDAGCGAGRFAEIAAERGARLVALDYSSAVEAAAKTLERFNNVDVVQASLLDPPFAPSTFDYAYCIGVVQHTPDRAAVLRNVAQLVGPGGSFCFTIYARRPWSKLNGKYLVRPLTKRLRPDTLLQIIESSMPVVFPVTNVLFRAPGVLSKIAHFLIPVANYVDTIDDPELRYRSAILDTFDMLSPQYDEPMTLDEVRTALQRAGVDDVQVRSHVPINVVGVR